MAAKDFAEYNTFTNDPGDFINAVNKLRNTDGTGEDSNMMLKAISHVVLPFLNTPANITRYTFERTPLAPITSKWRADMAAGGARRNLAMARMGIGSIAFGMAYDMALQGHITGAGPGGNDWAKRRTMTEAGWKGQSIRILKGEKDGQPVYEYYSINRLDPVGSIILMAAELADVMKARDFRPDVQWNKVVTATVFAASEVFLNKTYMSSLSDLIQAIVDPDGRGEYYVQRLTKTLIPRAVAQVKRTGAPALGIEGDPVRRHVHDLITALKSDTPGLSKTLPAKTDFFGREVSYSSGQGWAYDTFMPIYVSSTEKSLPIQREFMELDYFPTHRRSIKIKGTTDPASLSVRLENYPHIFEDMVQQTVNTGADKLLETALGNPRFMSARGGLKGGAQHMVLYGERTMTQVLNDMVTGKDALLSSRYQDAEADEKQQMIKDVIRHYRALAKEVILERYPELQAMRDQLPTREMRGERAPF